jgi:hypothetical protein
MALFDFIGSIFKPAAEIVDSLHTSSEEKLAAKEKLLAVQAGVLAQVLDYEKSLAQEQGQTVRAEATGHSWMQRNWRPMIMLMFGYVVAHNFIVVPIAQMFGAAAPVLELPPDLWDLLKIGIGGYVVGRSAEKIVPSTIAALKSKENA